MRSIIYFIGFFVLLASCHDAGQKAKEIINTTGKTVGEGASELGHGIKEGVSKSLECDITLSASLQKKGLQTGKYIVGQKNGNKENLLSIYIIFDQDFSQSVTAKIFDVSGKEYGRTNATIAGKKGEAKFFDFVFDMRTDIETKSKIILE